ncbi:serine hydrolase domain-containing protein [Sorangium sp. So ce362]|uniref:serine hydrolase domain-containing protein n=1 Tax=Sorangium sp. So ce362 TaxID=3133303 RepID=UPI003F60EABB
MTLATVVSSNPDLDARLRPLVVEAMRRQRAPGVAVAIVRDGSVVLAEGYGVADLTSGAPVTPETLFPMSSITKTFTGVAVMQLAEQGLISLDDPVSRHVPFFRLDDPRAQDITVRHLLTHTSGLPDCDQLALWDDPQLDDRALERYVSELPYKELLAAPGERRVYSNDGFEVLGALVAQVTGEVFERRVERTLLAPLGMSASRMSAPPADPRVRAAGHVLGDAGEVATAPVYPWSRSHAASGTLFSNALDMARWVRMLLGRGALDGVRVLAAETLEDMGKPLVPWEQDASISQGHVFRVYEHRGHRALGHGGWDVGFRCGMTLLPDVGVGAVVMSNFHWSAMLQLVHAALDVALGAEPPSMLPDPAALPGFVGTFKGERSATVVEVEGEDVYLVQGERRRRLTPLGPDTVVVSEGKGHNAVFVRRRAEETVVLLGDEKLTRVT